MIRELSLRRRLRSTRPARRFVTGTRTLLFGHPDDRLLASYPKSGSTWFRYVAAYAFGERPTFDNLQHLIPAIGQAGPDTPCLPGGGRILRSHESGDVLRRGRRFLVAVRDGRDVAVSTYYHVLRNGRFDGDWDHFLPLFLSGRLSAYGTWQEHVLSWIRAKEQGRPVRFLRYEDALEDPVMTLRPALAFLGLDAEDRLPEIVAATAPDRMRSEAQKSKRFGSPEGDGSIPLVRSATSGGWREHFSSADHDHFEQIAGDALRAAGYTDA